MSVAGRIYRGARSIDAPKQPRLVLPEVCPCCGRPRPGDPIVIRTARRTIRVPAEDVVMFRAADKIIEVWTSAGLAGVIEATLTDLGQRYPRMWRAHRSALIDPGAIRAVRCDRRPEIHSHRYSIELAGLDEPVPVSRREWARARGGGDSGAAR